MNIKDVSLLTFEEAEKYIEIVRNVLCANKSVSAWLRSPVGKDFVFCVISNGNTYVNGGGRTHKVVPALYFTPKGYKEGEVIEYKGDEYTVLEDGLALKNKPIGSCEFQDNAKHNDYRRSDVKKYIENWAESKGIEWEKEPYPIKDGVYTFPADKEEIGCRTFTGDTELGNVKTVIIPENNKLSCLESAKIDLMHNDMCIKEVIYRGVDISEGLTFNTYGADKLEIINTLIDNNMPVNNQNMETACDLSHRNLLENIAYVKDYGDMVNELAKDCRESVIKDLKKCFKEDERFHGHIPKIVDKLAIINQDLHLPPKAIVDSFDVGYVKSVLDKGKAIMPAMICKLAYDKNTCFNILDKGLENEVGKLVKDYCVTEKDKYMDVADFVVKHLDTNKDLIKEMVSKVKQLDINENTTVKEVKNQLETLKNFSEVEKINAEYDIDLNECKCNIPLHTVEHQGKTARILDFNNDKDIALGANLGYLTNCCQHLGSAGETAMMHGFLNPDAGFWVIEENGVVKAQAEIWVDEEGTLVFDNIEFANTDSDHTKDRVKELRGTIAAWAKDCPYEDVIMGTGYNELNFDKMEKAYTPQIILTAEELYKLDDEGEFKTVAEAREALFRTINSLNVDSFDIDETDYVYTDTEKCVYIKHDGEVDAYLMKGYNKDIEKDLRDRIKDNLDNKLFEPEPELEPDLELEPELERS